MMDILKIILSAILAMAVILTTFIVGTAAGESHQFIKDRSNVSV